MRGLSTLTVTSKTFNISILITFLLGIFKLVIEPCHLVLSEVRLKHDNIVSRKVISHNSFATVQQIRFIDCEPRRKIVENSQKPRGKHFTSSTSSPSFGDKILQHVSTQLFIHVHNHFIDFFKFRYNDAV